METFNWEHKGHKKNFDIEVALNKERILNLTNDNISCLEIETNGNFQSETIIEKIREFGEKTRTLLLEKKLKETLIPEYEDGDPIITQTTIQMFFDENKNNGDKDLSTVLKELNILKKTNESSKEFCDFLPNKYLKFILKEIEINTSKKKS